MYALYVGLRYMQKEKYKTGQKLSIDSYCPIWSTTDIGDGN